jgi:uncharacterized protein with PQ loop repeat
VKLIKEIEIGAFYNLVFGFIIWFVYNLIIKHSKKQNKKKQLKIIKPLKKITIKI